MTTFFTRAEFERAPKTLLRDGRIANAKVYRLTLAGKDWTVKDFSERPWYIRETIGHALIALYVRCPSDWGGLIASALRERSCRFPLSSPVNTRAYSAYRAPTESQ